MTSVLVAYATRNGSTREVAERVGERLGARGLDVDVRPANEVADLDGCDAVVLGGALYMGRLHKDARDFLRCRGDRLASLPFAVFAMGPRTLEEADVAGSRRQLAAALARVSSVRPMATAVFGGVLDPTKLHFPFNHLAASDARDWDAIDGWAGQLAAQIRLTATTSS